MIPNSVKFIDAKDNKTTNILIAMFKTYVKKHKQHVDSRSSLK